MYKISSFRKIERKQKHSSSLPCTTTNKPFPLSREIFVVALRYKAFINDVIPTREQRTANCY